MKLYFLYLLIAAIALLAHLGARADAEAEADKAAPNRGQRKLRRRAGLPPLRRSGAHSRR